MLPANREDSFPDTDLTSLSSVPGISAVPHEENLRYFDVTIDGPDSSPYQGARRPDRCSNAVDKADRSISRWHVQP